MDTAIVIGGGPAGLIAAAHLAGAGVDTTLLEAKARLGGRAASDHQEGFFLNQGPHALYAGGPAMRELKALDIDLPRWNPTAVTRFELIRGGRTRRAVGGWGAIARLARADAPPTMTANEWLEANLKPKHRDLAKMLLRVTCFVADHDVLPADVARQQLRLGAVPGVRYLRGGWQSLVDALAAKAEANGATLRTQTKVTDLGDLSADAIIVAAGLPGQAAKLVDGVTAPGPPSEVSVLDLGLAKLPRRTVLAFGVDEPTYYSRHSPPDQDATLMTAMSYAGAPLTELEGIADTVHPGWREHQLLHRHLPKMVPVSAVASPTRRPPVEHGNGVFLAGDWVGGEGWLVDAALASGVAAAKAALATAPKPVAAA